MEPRRFSHDTNGRNANVPPGLGVGLVSMVFWGIQLLVTCIVGIYFYMPFGRSFSI